MIKVIVSHDVDHLYTGDHWKHDLILEKFLVRNFIQLFRREITFKVFLKRLPYVFRKRMCRIPEILAFDKMHSIPSSFFFGTDNILGMSYSPEQAKPWVQYVADNGFDVGVHAAVISDFQSMKKEFERFRQFRIQERFGVRVHYVRYDDSTFTNMAEIGYKFDTSEFCKEKITLTQPYPVKAANGNIMWEFPLHVMDGYVIEKNAHDAKKLVLDALDEAERNDNVRYFTFLFHDIYFDEHIYPIWIDFYKWFIGICEERKLPFISYDDAIKEILHND